MPALDLDTTYQSKPIDRDRDKPSITRTGADIRLPSLAKARTFVRLVGSAQEADQFVLLAPRDPWLIETIRLIDDHRNLAKGWDGECAEPPEAGALDTAEMLSVFLNSNGPGSRPTFSVDSLGRPTFAARTNNFYIHLTVDKSERITWFAEVDGVEHFHDDVEFKGRKLPDELSAILS
ncbi:hypothetical protein [Tardiphaga robiniae]|uniref:hypothetical protein n=1 Tax=Tardiphaga robiniae TaxID=943830 RepID=UPI001586634D|nr:hypothetical protein [Tardiphaga robiniae]NUU44540.1 hypothetical protein [Tardiphaga robiniae]